MNTTVKSLQALYVKNGGLLTDTYSDIAGGAAVGNYTTIPDMIAACAKLNIGGGGGGAEKFVVTLTKSGSTWTADKTIAEIVAAVNANKVVEGYATGITDYPLLLTPSVATTNEGVSFVGFYGVFGGDDNYAVIIVVGTDQGGSDFYYNSAALLAPTAGGDDAGKILTVSAGGYPVWAESNAPLIVTLTAGQEEGTFVGDKTFAEIHAAKASGRVVVLTDGANAALDVIGSVIAGEGYAAFCIGIDGQTATATGQGSDYISV